MTHIFFKTKSGKMKGMNWFNPGSSKRDVGRAKKAVGQFKARNPGKDFRLL